MRPILMVYINHILTSKTKVHSAWSEVYGQPECITISEGNRNICSRAAKEQRNGTQGLFQLPLPTR